MTLFLITNPCHLSILFTILISLLNLRRPYSFFATCLNGSSPPLVAVLDVKS